MKKLLLIVALCIIGLSAYAQGGANLSDRSRPLLSAPGKSVGRNMGFAYKFDSFLTPEFQEAKGNDWLSTGGLCGTLEYGLFGPFSLQLGAFASMYNFKDSVAYLDYVIEQGEYWRIGAEAYLNWYVLPYIGLISNLIKPYIGVGYQYSVLKLGDERINTGAPMFQGCLRLNLGSAYFDVGYQQSLPIGDIKPQNFVLFGGGFSL
jgi:hypothetical protein